jgi:branched-chain amino acid transport system permease protein
MFTPSILFQFLISGIGIGCIYGLVGVGLCVIFNASGVVNFAQGAFVMLGGMLTYMLFNGAGLPLLVSALCAIALVTALGFIMEFFIIRWLRHRNVPMFNAVLATLAVQVILENSTLHVLGDKPRDLPSFSDSAPLRLFGASINVQILWILVVSLVMVWLLGLLYRKTLIGKAMRASSVNSDAASLLGISSDRMIAYSFALSAALGAVGGVLITPVQYTAFNSGVPFALSGFIAAVVGGLGNPAGAFLGGIVLGALQTIAIVLFGGGTKDVVSLTLLLVLLLFRPQGLFRLGAGAH